ncbi:hypothetical protein EDD27_7627 [Nonomuraea polychroma]|uniref:Uncharacterized protein n=1 Tax=Nonomuraea polychroma TaxID=46176 RepID=A0A438MGA8_9ACTN|nr:hypothetical protein [Nonomuraea polychroma]RVX44869.1 hypothetical protein EDD27_7627 [Nonomuraea polychroma]
MQRARLAGDGPVPAQARQRGHRPLLVVTGELVAALQNPHEADHWFSGHLPGQEGWLHRDLALALADRADDFETVLPAALGLTTLSFTLDYSNDLDPFVELAFPQPLAEHSVLTQAQRTFLAALHHHRCCPFDEALCRYLLGI